VRGANLRGITARLAGILPDWYPVPFGVAFVLNQMADDGIAMQAGIRTLIVAILVTAALSVAGRRLTRHPDRGTLLGLAVFFVLLAGDESVWLLAAGAVAFVLLVDLRGARTGGRAVPWSAMRSGLSAIAVILLVLVTLPVIGSRTAFPTGPQPASAGGSAARPDIFVILLDGFGRPDVLATYGHDASPFVAGLEARGFSVAAHSRSNYPTTGLALTSMLNAVPISALGLTDNRQLGPRQVYPALEANRAFDILAEAGYETIAYSSGYELVSLRSANRFVDTGQLNELEIVLAESTILEPLMDALTGDLSSSQIRARAMAMAPAVRSLAAEASDRPRFVFVHFPLPHPPYVVDSHCRAIRGGESLFALSSEGTPRKPASRMAEEIRLTAGQAGCVERLAVEMVDGILAGGGPDTVVLVLSDHGPETRLERSDPQPDAIHDRLANLFAARTPGHPDLFPDDITLVNVLPRLFGAYLNVELPVQPDTVYFGMPGVGLVPVDSAAR
jgi:hypothetical protein